MIFSIKKTKDYELLDSGLGQKLERYGSVVFSRPDPEALWGKNLPESTWGKANGTFTRKGTKAEWKLDSSVPKSFNIEFGGFTFSIRPTSFKHTGLFPEQLANWEWMSKIIKSENTRTVKVLNLFAYTGGATLACAAAGAEVVHLDSSKMAVAWARENALNSNLSDKPVRWIVDDVLVFLKREVKRGNKYDCIVMDPPAFGHGPKDELWKIEESFLELVNLCQQVLSDDPLFVLINGYTAGYSPIAYENVLKDMMKAYKGQIEIGELAIEESNSERLLPAGIFARWHKK